MGRKNLKEIVYDSILESIYSSEFRPNEIITESGLIKKFGFSKSPVREALTALCHEGVLHNIPRCGYQVIAMTTEDVEIVHMDFPAAYQALMTGNCDVAALNPPTSYQAEAEGMVITSSLTSLDVPQFDSIIVSNKAFNEKRDLLVKYVKAFFEATDALQADPDMQAQLLYDWYTENGSETTLEACKDEISTRPFVTSEEAKNITVGDSVQVTGEFWVSQLLDESKFPELATHIDDTIVKEALGF